MFAAFLGPTYPTIPHISIVFLSGGFGSFYPIGGENTINFLFILRPWGMKIFQFSYLTVGIGIPQSYAGILSSVNIVR